MTKNYLRYNPITNLPNKVQSNSCPEALGIPQVVLRPIKSLVQFLKSLFSTLPDVLVLDETPAKEMYRQRREGVEKPGGKLPKKSTLINQRSVSKDCKKVRMSVTVH